MSKFVFAPDTFDIGLDVIDTLDMKFDTIGTLGMVLELSISNNATSLGLPTNALLFADGTPVYSIDGAYICLV